MDTLKGKFFFSVGLYLILGFFSVTLQSATIPMTPNIVPAYDIKKYNAVIEQVLQLVEPSMRMNERINMIGRYFLNKPYLLGALGEGFVGEYDQNPLYRTDSFDCLTYVSTVLALAFSNNVSEFVANHKKIQYQYGEPRYRFRNHFTNIDWNANNAQAGYITDITKTLKYPNHSRVAFFSRTYIDKKNWYRQKRMSSLKLLQAPPPKEAQALLKALQNEAENVTNTFSDLYFIPLTALFDAQGNPQKFIFDQIPSASIIEIVRPNWDLRKQIGTRLDISHLGFAVQKNGQLLFLNASSNENKVVEQPLDLYLKSFLNSPTIKGISIYQINERI